MTHRGSRVLHVGSLSRVEGEGALSLHVHDGTVTDARLEIYEPPRFFEAFLRGRSYTEPPDITARVCGICPVAYQMSACAAIEDACGVAVDPVIRDLRRLLYCGEWIESQALHIYLLHAPDFLGLPSAIDLARTHRTEVERGLRLKKAGNSLMELLGGRAVHPVNVRLGGFHRAPVRTELRTLNEELKHALDDAWATVRWVAGFEFPDASVEADLFALTEPDTYAIEGGTPTVLRADGTNSHFPVREFTEHVSETHVAHSTALHSRLDGRLHLTGSLARFAISGRIAVAAGVGGGGRGGARRSARGRGVPQSVPVHPGARGRDRVRRRRGAAHHRRLRAARAPVHGGAPGRRMSGTEPPRRRAGCSTTATNSMATASCRARCWCRPPRRTRVRSRTTCAAWPSTRFANTTRTTTS